eukprot:16172-Eustigmatos_ZCMA.PRE.1
MAFSLSEYHGAKLHTHAERRGAERARKCPESRAAETRRGRSFATPQRGHGSGYTRAVAV